jgi:hypothetical protein
MVAGLRRHDKSSPHLKPGLSKAEGARNFNLPRDVLRNLILRYDLA